MSNKYTTKSGNRYHIGKDNILLNIPRGESHYIGSRADILHLAEIIKQIAKDELNNWIPVSKSPQENGEYLLVVSDIDENDQTRYFEIIGSFNNNEWYYDEYAFNGKPIYWQELPALPQNMKSENFRQLKYITIPDTEENKLLVALVNPTEDNLQAVGLMKPDKTPPIPNGTKVIIDDE